MRQHTFLCHSHPLLSGVSSQENSRLLQTLRHWGEEGKGAGTSLSQLCGNQQVPAFMEALEIVIDRTVVPPKRECSNGGHHRTWYYGISGPLYRTTLTMMSVPLFQLAFMLASVKRTGKTLSRSVLWMETSPPESRREAHETQRANSLSVCFPPFSKNAFGIHVHYCLNHPFNPWYCWAMFPMQAQQVVDP